MHTHTLKLSKFCPNRLLKILYTLKVEVYSAIHLLESMHRKFSRISPDSKFPHHFRNNNTFTMDDGRIIRKDSQQQNIFQIYATPTCLYSTKIAAELCNISFYAFII
jgi:hypothetical protein